MNKYIIGGGISGLIWRFYNPEFRVISPDTGGNFSKSHLVWLHDCYETRKLLLDLGWTNPGKYAKKSHIGYFQHGWVSNFLTDEMNLSIIQKKMTEWNKPIDRNFIPKTRDLSLSAGTMMGINYMNTLDVDLSEVLNRLNKNIDAIEGFVTQIETNRILIQRKGGETGIWLKYDELISTIPAPIFWRSWGVNREFESLPTTNVITNVKPPFFDKSYEMIYYNDEMPFSRVSFVDGKYAMEFTGVLPVEVFHEKFPDIPVVDHFVVPYGRIRENEENVSPSPNITFSGRFAQWKYGVTSEFIIAQALNYNEKTKSRSSEQGDRKQVHEV